MYATELSKLTGLHDIIVTYTWVATRLYVSDMYCDILGLYVFPNLKPCTYKHGHRAN